MNIEDPQKKDLQDHVVYIALTESNTEIAIALLEAGLDLNVMITSNSVLCEAIRLGNEIVALYLIDRDADVNKTKGKEHGTLLLYAIENNMIAIIQELLDHNADVEATGTLHGQPTIPILLAAKEGSIEIMQMLLANGALVNAQNDRGFSAWHVAAGEGHDELLRILVHEHEAELGVALFNGSLPIHSAASRGTPASIELLLDAGSDLEATSDDGRIPLHWAAESRRWNNVRTLLDRGAKTSVRAGESKLTALDLVRLGQQNLSGYPSFYQPEKEWSKENLDLLFERMGI